jgi:hypothetical protein
VATERLADVTRRRDELLASAAFDPGEGGVTAGES